VTDFIKSKVDGLTALAVVPTIDERLPPEIREGIARRRLMATGQACPCGARPIQLSRATRRRIEARKRKGLPGEVINVVIEHEDDCPATNDALAAAAEKHGISMRWLPL
jgi:hypothetical protein